MIFKLITMKLSSFHWTSPFASQLTCSISSGSYFSYNDYIQAGAGSSKIKQ